MPRERKTTHSAAQHLSARRAPGVMLRTMLVLVGLVGALLIALFTLEQATLKPLAEFTVERITGRSLRIDGELDAVAGRVVSLRAEGVSLANADWGRDQPMLQIEGIELSIDLFGFLSDGYLVERVDIDGGELLFEKNADGLSNWAMKPGGEQSTAESEQAALVALPIHHGRVSGISITVIDPGLANPVDIQIKQAVHEVRVGQRLWANVDAEINKNPFTLESQITSSGVSRAGAGVDLEAEAVFAATRLAVEGHLDNLFQPGQVNLRLNLESEEISTIGKILGLPAMITGATDIEARLAPEGDHHVLEVSGKVEGLEFDAQAQLQALDSLDGLSVALKAAAPNLASIVHLPGARQLPARPIEVESRLALSGTRLEIGETRIDYGDIHLTAAGVMSRFPNPEGANLNFRVEGENYVVIADMFEYSALHELKPGAFRVSANLDYGSLAQQTFEVDLEIAGLDGKLTGIIAGYPSFSGTRVEYRLAGEDARLLQQWARTPDRIEGAYRLEGRITRTDTGFDIGETEFSVGENRLDFSGRIGNDPLRRDTALTLRFEGRELGTIAAMAGYNGSVPAGPATLDAVTQVRDGNIVIDNFDLRFERSHATASGIVTRKPKLAGSRVEIALAADDIADLLPPGFDAYLQTGQAFEMTGVLAAGGERLEVNDLEARLGETRLQASGSTSLEQPLRDTLLQVSVNGPDLAAILPAELIPYALPRQPFTFNGGIGFDGTGLILEKAVAEVGSESLNISGSIPLADPQEGLKLELAVRGSNIRILLPVELDTYGVDKQPYEAAANLALGDGKLLLRQLQFKTARGNVSGEVSLSIADPRSFGQFDLVASGDNLQLFLPPLSPYRPAAESFSLDARGGWSSTRLEVEHGTIEIDSSRIDVRGELGLQPGEVVSQLVVSARGDSLDELGQVDDLDLPEGAYRLEATVESDAGKISSPALQAQIGESDFQGRFSYEFGDRPNIEVSLDSRLIDLTRILNTDGATEDPVEDSMQTAGHGRLIPDLPVPIEYLERWNLVFEGRVDELRLPYNVFNEIEFETRLEDGKLSVNRLRARGIEGELFASFLASAEDGRLFTHGEVQAIEIVLGGGAVRSEGVVFPKQNYHIEFDTSGATVRELAANLNGYTRITGAEGRLNNNSAMRIFGSFFGELISSVNPFVTREPFTTISCFVTYAEIVDGVATINPGAVVQTDKIDIFARGQIDLRTERIDLRFDTTARQGLGISLGSFVNPFVGVGGTLAAPRLGLDPKNAMFEGGAAVVTGGTTVVLKSLFRRWFSSNNPCTDITAEAEKSLAERGPAKEPEASPGD